MKEEGIDLLIEKFRHDESFFKDILRTQKDWIWEVNKEGIYTYCSEHIKSILGYTPQEILGKKAFNLMPPEEATRVSAKFNKIAEEQDPIIDLENWTLHKNGELVCLLTNGVPFYDKAGNWLGYRGTDKKITVHKNAEEKQHTTHQQLLDIIEFLPDATFVIDNEKKIIAWNRAIEEMTGIHKQDILNKGNYAYAIPFYGKRRPILIDLIGIEDKKRNLYMITLKDLIILCVVKYSSLPCMGVLERIYGRLLHHSLIKKVINTEQSNLSEISPNARIRKKREKSQKKNSDIYSKILQIP